MEYQWNAEYAAQMLRDADCPKELTDRFLKALAAGDAGEQLRLLRLQRGRQLQQVHAEEKKLDILDFMRYRLEKPAAAPARKRAVDRL